MKKIISLIVFSGALIFGQEPKENQSPATNATGSGAKSPAIPKIKNMEDGLKGKKIIPGLITLYQDTATGKLSMVLDNDQLGKEFIYFVHARDGQRNAGVIRGSYRGSKIITFNRYFNRVEFEVQNHSFYFDPSNPLSRAADANITTAILASEFIIACVLYHCKRFSHCDEFKRTQEWKQWDSSPDLLPKKILGFPLYEFLASHKRSLLRTADRGVLPHTNPCIHPDL